MLLLVLLDFPLNINISRLLLLVVIMVIVTVGLLDGVRVGPRLEEALALDLLFPLDLGGSAGGGRLGLPLPLAVESVVVGRPELGLPLEVPAAGGPVLGGPLDLPAVGLGGVGVLAAGRGGGGGGGEGERAFEGGHAVAERVEEERVEVEGRATGRGDGGVGREEEIEVEGVDEGGGRGGEAERAGGGVEGLVVEEEAVVRCGGGDVGA